MLPPGREDGNYGGQWLKFIWGLRNNAIVDTLPVQSARREVNELGSFR